MKIEERSYRAQSMRPRPTIYQDEVGETMMVMTSWGKDLGVKKVQEVAVDYLTAATSDVEVTIPFEYLSCLSTRANQLRIAGQLANDQLYRQENRIKYEVGVEFVSLSRDKNELAWVQVGMPNIILMRPGVGFIPISCSMDSSLDGNSVPELTPMPVAMLGLESSVNINTGSLRIFEGDRILLISGALIAPALWSEDATSASLQTLSAHMSNQWPTQAYWMGIVSL
jgi:hypothetical protein